ncbi:hypothetical protein J8273_4376 [Carpediemonas membranifera]|uniref:Uncharacterized protein n=1 Tax=Carpediemonas membranifera TaxID=201153 RepID=A0A8J6B6T2_9EUKA|nr:hypothetical protein J8273_4376 [Carpediemonas membranifera]|eukprot:KAG9394274.1 hypothetical protein J8273_4376 [Carpediemonas membranifera]
MSKNVTSGKKEIRESAKAALQTWASRKPSEIPAPSTQVKTQPVPMTRVTPKVARMGHGQRAQQRTPEIAPMHQSRHAPVDPVEETITAAKQVIQAGRSGHLTVEDGIQALTDFKNWSDEFVLEDEPFPARLVRYLVLMVYSVVDNCQFAEADPYQWQETLSETLSELYCGLTDPDLKAIKKEHLITPSHRAMDGSTAQSARDIYRSYQQTIGLILEQADWGITLQTLINLRVQVALEQNNSRPATVAQLPRSQRAWCSHDQLRLMGKEMDDTIFRQFVPSRFVQQPADLEFGLDAFCSMVEECNSCLDPESAALDNVMQLAIRIIYPLAQEGSTLHVIDEYLRQLPADHPMAGVYEMVESSIRPQSVRPRPTRSSRPRPVEEADVGSVRPRTAERAPPSRKQTRGAAPDTGAQLIDLALMKYRVPASLAPALAAEVSTITSRPVSSYDELFTLVDKAGLAPDLVPFLGAAGVPPYVVEIIARHQQTQPEMTPVVGGYETRSDDDAEDEVRSIAQSMQQLEVEPLATSHVSGLPPRQPAAHPPPPAPEPAPLTAVPEYPRPPAVASQALPTPALVSAAQRRPETPMTQNTEVPRSQSQSRPVPQSVVPPAPARPASSLYSVDLTEDDTTKNLLAVPVLMTRRRRHRQPRSKREPVDLTSLKIESVASIREKLANQPPPELEPSPEPSPVVAAMNRSALKLPPGRTSRVVHSPANEAPRNKNNRSPVVKPADENWEERLTFLLTKGMDMTPLEYAECVELSKRFGASL